VQLVGKQLQLQMQIVHLYRSPGHNYFGHHGLAPSAHELISCESLHCVAGRGIEGDRFFDYKANYKGQITFFEMETYERLCEQFGIRDKSPGVFRRNVLTRGANLNELIGVEFEVQGVRFLGTDESKPCYWMDQAFAPGAEQALKGHGGLRARILTDGVLRIDRTESSYARPQSAHEA
jgi:MOSC domain-containing protein YiiM